MNDRVVIVYSYYGSPWSMSCGDDVRIHLITKSLSMSRGLGVVLAINLSQYIDKPVLDIRDGVLYLSIPRKLYRLLKKVFKWRYNYDLNPLIKLTHYIDELASCIYISSITRHRGSCAVYIFGSMTLASLFTRFYRVKDEIIYDPLSNYAQTLYLRSRDSFLLKIVYGLYLILHRLQLRCSNKVVYPSTHDLYNAKRMFKVENTFVIENPVPICYNSEEEYLVLRSTRRDHGKPYFLLLAGSRGRVNEEVVRNVIEVFNRLKHGNFKLYITGPWTDMKPLVKNPGIVVKGVVSLSELKRLVAISDYGLSPVFSHGAGVFVKVLTYLVGGLDLIVSPHSLQGISKDVLKKCNVYVVSSFNDLEPVVNSVIERYRFSKKRHFISCKELYRRLYRGVEKLFRISY